METQTERTTRSSDTFEEYLADDAWAGEGGNIAAGDPAPPRTDLYLATNHAPRAA
jgi:hypothetical protein